MKPIGHRPEFGTWRVSVERTAPEPVELAAMYDAAVDRWHRSVGGLGYSRVYSTLFGQHFSSIGSVGEGLSVPPATVEIVFERKQIAENASRPELWRDYVLDYWTGKDVLVEYGHREIHGPNRARGSFTLYHWENIGRFLGADSTALQVSVHPIEHGTLPRATHYPFTRVTRLKLMENETRNSVPK
jgi:hypothetical protein